MRIAATERKGSPHTLVCVKNQASYERAKQQQALDIQMWHEIERLSATTHTGKLGVLYPF